MMKETKGSKFVKAYDQFYSTVKAKSRRPPLDDDSETERRADVCDEGTVNQLKAPMKVKSSNKERKKQFVSRLKQPTVRIDLHHKGSTPSSNTQ